MIRIVTEKCSLCGYEHRQKWYDDEEGKGVQEDIYGDERFQYTSVPNDTNQYYAKYKHFLICPKCGVVLLEDIVRKIKYIK